MINSSTGSGKNNLTRMFSDPISNGQRNETDDILDRFFLVMIPQLKRKLSPQARLYIEAHAADFIDLIHPFSFKALQAHGKDAIFERKYLAGLVESLAKLIEMSVMHGSGSDRLKHLWAHMRMIGSSMPGFNMPVRR